MTAPRITIPPPPRRPVRAGPSVWAVRLGKGLVALAALLALVWCALPDHAPFPKRVWIDAAELSRAGSGTTITSTRDAPAGLAIPDWICCASGGAAGVPPTHLWLWEGPSLKREIGEAAVGLVATRFCGRRGRHHRTGREVVDGDTCWLEFAS